MSHKAKRAMKKFLTMLLVWLTLIPSARAETLRVGGVGIIMAETFAAAHPEVEVISPDGSTAQYTTTAELSGPMQTREFNLDVFGMDVGKVDVHLLMEKGYLLDLSGSEVIRNAVARMHPAIAEQCMIDGKIYAVPSYLQADHGTTLMVDPDCWAETGYTLEDIPQSYPAFLDFIEAYLARREDDPNLTVNIYGGMDDYLYGPEKYARWLVELLLNNHIAQTLYAGEPLRFNDPELEALLERAISVSKRIYALEPTKSSERMEPGLFIGKTGLSLSWTTFQQTRVDLRLREDQPALITGDLLLTAVSAATHSPELAIELVEAALPEMWPYAAVLVYTDAEPIVNPTYEDDVRNKMNMLALTERMLAGDHTPYAEYMDLNFNDPARWSYDAVFAKYQQLDEWELQDELDYWLNRAGTDEPYYFSPDDLAAYQAFAPGLYFPGPTVFDTTSNSASNFSTLVRQLTDGLITVHEFCQQADRIAWMMEMENQ